MLCFIKVELVVDLELLHGFRSPAFVLLDIDVKILKEQFYCLNDCPGRQEVLSLQDVTIDDIGKPRLQVIGVFDDKFQRLHCVLQKTISLLYHIKQLLLVRECALLIFETNQVQRVNVHRMVLELDTEDAYVENDLGVAEESVRTSLEALADDELLSVVEELLDKRIETEFLQLPRDLLFRKDRLVAALAVDA